MTLRTGLMTLIGFFSMACKPPIVGSGQHVTKTFPLEGFAAVEAGHSFDLDLRQAPTHQVEITIDDNLAQYLKVSKRGETLVLELDHRFSYRPSQGGLKASVSLPALSRLNLSGAAQASLAGFQSGERVQLELSGASELRGELQAGELDLGLSGASEIALSGACAKLSVDISGASEADLVRLQAESVQAELSGASEVAVKTDGRLDAELSGASTLRYAGKPTLGAIQTSGASNHKPY